MLQYDACPAVCGAMLRGIEKTMKMTDSTETIRKFLEYEENGDLFDFIVGGCRIWAYMRFNVYMKIEEMINDQNKRESKNDHFGFREICRIIRNCTISNPQLRAKQKDYLIVTHARRTLVDGSYECLYTDELAAKLADKACSAEFIYGNTHMMPAKTRGLLYLDYIDIFPVLQKFKKKQYDAEIKQIRQRFKEIRKEISECFGVELSEAFLVNTAVKRFLWYQLKKPYLKKLVKKIRPKAIIEVVSYETNKMLLNEVAYELGIPTVELQHGVIGRGHAAYNYLRKHDYSYFPQYVFLFSEFWKRTAGFAQSEDRLIPVGYPYLERMMSRYPMADADPSGTLHILVLSQPEYSVKLLRDVEKLVGMLEESGMNYRLLYKLHPAEYRMDNSAFDNIRANQNVEVIATPDISLYELFPRCQIQIGVTSTAIFEGLAYELKTLILHYEKTDLYMGDLCRNHYATMCESERELFENVVSYQRKEDAAGEHIRELFFVRNALENMTAELKRIEEGNLK